MAKPPKTSTLIGSTTLPQAKKRRNSCHCVSRVSKNYVVESYESESEGRARSPFIIEISLPGLAAGGRRSIAPRAFPA